MPARLTLALCAALVQGCSDFPDLAAAVDPAAVAAPYPALVSLDGLLTEAAAPATPSAVAALRARAAELRARAAALRALP